MRRRSRGSRFTWMPMLGTTFTGGEGGSYQTNNIRVILSARHDNSLPPTQGGDVRGIPSLVITPLVPDYTEQPDPAHGLGMTLADYTQGQDWFLRRIVGKLQIACAANQVGDTQLNAWPALLVTAGFFVARAQDASPGVVDGQEAEFDPQALDNIRQPWIWRRTWTLGAAQVAASGTEPQWSAVWPNSTEEFGSMADGGHIDAKTLRRIRREQRLWFAMSCVGTGEFDANTAVSGTDEEQPIIYANMDVRVLGAMRRSNNKSTF